MKGFPLTTPLDIQSIVLRRLQALYLPSGGNVPIKDSFQRLGKLASSGYILDSVVTTAFIGSTVEAQEASVLAVTKAKGDDSEFRPFRARFYEVVPNMSSTQLAVEQIVHYIGAYHFGVSILPGGKPDTRELADRKLVPLGLANEADVTALFQRLAGQNSPFSAQDKSDLKLLAEFIDSDSLEIKSPIKENMVWLFKELKISVTLKTLVDVLRMAVALSDGDISLATPTRFKLKRADRKFIAQSIVKVLTANGGNIEDVARHPEMWKRLIGTAHLAEHDYRLKDFVNLIYKDAVEGDNAKVEKLIREMDAPGLLGFLATRPGIFARRLGELIREFPRYRSEIVTAFGEVAPKVSTRVLVQLHNHYTGADSTKAPVKILVSKTGATGKSYENTLAKGDYSDVLGAIRKGLENRLKGTKVALENANMANFVAVSTSERHASASHNLSVAKGSRFPIPEGKDIVRLFTFWKNNPGQSIDIDTSYRLYKDDLESWADIAYYNQRGEWGYMSGDIVNAPNGAAEYADILIKKALNEGFRYVVTTAHIYSGVSTLKEIETLSSGVAFRTKGDGKDFEPSEVELNFTPSGEGTASAPFVIDLLKREVIWLDMPIGRHRSLVNSPVKPMVLNEAHRQAPVMTLSEYLALAGAEVVDSKEEADMTINTLSTDSVLQVLN